MRRFLLAAGLASAAFAPAQAAPVFVGGFASDAAFTTFLASRGASLPGGEVFVAQGRIGRPGAADYEAGLHPRVGSGTEAPTNFSPIGGGGQIAWASGTSVAFALSRSGDTVTFTMGGHNQSWTSNDVSEVTALGFRAGSVSPGGSVTLASLVVNGTPLAFPDAPFEATNGAPNLAVLASLPANFTLTGQATLNWSGPMPTGSRLAFQIKGLEGFTAVPGPGAAGLLLFGLVGLAMAARRKGAATG